MLKHLRRILTLPAAATRRGAFAAPTLIRLAAIVAVVAIAATPAMAAGDFGALARKIEETARMFAGPFAVVAVVVVGSYVAMGHAQSGEQIRNLLLGLVFLGLALIGGTAILTMVGG